MGQIRTSSGPSGSIATASASSNWPSTALETGQSASARPQRPPHPADAVWQQRDQLPAPGVGNRLHGALKQCFGKAAPTIESAKDKPAYATHNSPSLGFVPPVYKTAAEEKTDMDQYLFTHLKDGGSAHAVWGSAPMALWSGCPGMLEKMAKRRGMKDNFVLLKGPEKTGWLMLINKYNLARLVEKNPAYFAKVTGCTTPHETVEQIISVIKRRRGDLLFPQKAGELSDEQMLGTLLGFGIDNAGRFAEAPWRPLTPDGQVPAALQAAREIEAGGKAAPGGSPWVRQPGFLAADTEETATLMHHYLNESLDMQEALLKDELASDDQQSAVCNAFYDCIFKAPVPSAARPRE